MSAISRSASRLSVPGCSSGAFRDGEEGEVSQGRTDDEVDLWGAVERWRVVPLSLNKRFETPGMQRRMSAPAMTDPR